MSAPELPTREALKKRVGSMLRNKWRLDELIDVGGMAAIYSATHQTGARAAVKILHEPLAGNTDVCQRFLREGYVANAVDHPGAVTVLDDGTTEGGSPYLVMELLIGTSLHDRLEERGKLEVAEVLYITDQVLDVLVAAHEKAIVHRDIKPANLFLTREGKVKVLDFGLARMRQPNSSFEPTRDGMVLGTPSFSAPEQARGENDKVDWRTDIWGIGAVAFNALTGRYVHDEPTTLKRLLAAATKPAPSLADVEPGLPGDLVALIDTALAFDKEKRHQTARVMQDATRRVYHIISGGEAPTSEVITDRLSWTDSPSTNLTPAQASVTLISGREASSESIEVLFEEPIRVIDTRKKPSADPTLTSEPPTANDDELVTESMITEAPSLSKTYESPGASKPSTEPKTAPTQPPTIKNES
jgi:serine/threonine protein kinase